MEIELSENEKIEDLQFKKLYGTINSTLIKN